MAQKPRSYARTITKKVITIKMTLTELDNIIDMLTRFLCRIGNNKVI